MSVAFSSARPRSKGEVTQQTIQKVKTWMGRGVCGEILESGLGVCGPAASAEESSLW